MQTNHDTFREINVLLSKENDYLQVIKGYCESQLDTSDSISKVFSVLEAVCDMHNDLCDKVDDLFTELGI